MLGCINKGNAAADTSKHLCESKVTVSGGTGLLVMDFYPSSLEQFKTEYKSR